MTSLFGHINRKAMMASLLALCFVSNRVTYVAPSYIMVLVGSVIEGGADAATSINVAVFNAGIGLGALVGGLIINHAGSQSIPVASAVMVILGLIVILVTGRR